MVAYMLLCGHLPWKREQGQITTADLYVDMGEGKFFDRKVNILCLDLSLMYTEGQNEVHGQGQALGQLQGMVRCMLWDKPGR